MRMQETIKTEINHMTVMKNSATKMSITHLVITIEVATGSMEIREIFTRSGQHHGKGKC